MSEQSCALCEHFKMKEHPEHAKAGLGRCMGRDAGRVDRHQAVPALESPGVRAVRAGAERRRPQGLDRKARRAGAKQQRSTTQNERMICTTLTKR
jgi:hypothetical protein